VRLTVLGCGTATTDPATPASGFLVSSGSTRILLDAGPGVVGRLVRHIDPTTLSAVVISHLHFDHYLDLVALRYLLPWSGLIVGRMPVFLPPGGRQRLADLETAITERPGFFDAAMDIVEFDPEASLSIGRERIELRFAAAQHYVPAWSVIVADGAGSRLVYGGDSGPTERLAELAGTADLVVLEATLGSPAEDDLERGHMTIDEAIALVERAAARRTLIVHYPWHRRAELVRRAARAAIDISIAVPDLVLEVGLASGSDRLPFSSAI
jgi:ribonuclease BN (tRNA processing enzyme)